MLGAAPLTPALAATGAIVLSQVSGAPGTAVSLTATGFTPNTTYTILWQSQAVGVIGNTGNGIFTAAFTVPNFQRATYGVTVTTTAPDGSNTVLFAVTPAVALSVGSGGVGDQITVSGVGFSASSLVSVYFDNAAIVSTTSSTLGTFIIALPIPPSIFGVHSVRGLDQTFGDFSPISSFTVLQRIAVTPTEAAVGAPLTITGRGFSASQTVSIYFDEVFASSTATDSLGSFTLSSFNLPASAFGSHTIRAQDATSNSHTINVNTRQTMTLTPVSGPIGTKATLNGTGFRASEPIIITYDNAVLSAVAASTDAKGSFNVTLDIPASSGGIHQVKAADSVNSDTKAFTVSAAAVATPASGFVGAKISVTGTGFLASQNVNILFDNVLAKQAPADAGGSFSTSFDAPARAAGKYAVRITDGANTKDMEFTITTTATITSTSTSSPGNVGSPITVSGVGFGAGKTVTVIYDGRQIATGTVGADAKFSVTFNAPEGKAGQHPISVSDGVSTLPFNFFMESSPPPAPALVEPEPAARAEAGATMVWGSVADPSGVKYTLQIALGTSFSSLVFEKTGLTTTEYTLTEDEKLQPSTKDNPYYWRVKAIDGAGNESNWSNARSFSVGTPFPMWAIYVLIGLGVLIIILLAFWLGRRAAVNKPRSTRLDDQGQPS
jgi:hypothetical protein